MLPLQLKNKKLFSSFLINDLELHKLMTNYRLSIQAFLIFEWKQSCSFLIVRISSLSIPSIIKGQWGILACCGGSKIEHAPIPTQLNKVRLLKSDCKKIISCEFFSNGVNDLSLIEPGRELVEVNVSWSRHPLINHLTKQKQIEHERFIIY